MIIERGRGLRSGGKRPYEFVVISERSCCLDKQLMLIGLTV